MLRVRCMPQWQVLSDTWLIEGLCQQVDMFSDYASVSGSSLSRASSAAGDVSGSSSPSAEERHEGRERLAVADRASCSSPQPFFPAAAEQARTSAEQRRGPGLTTALSGSLQSTVESLHAIVEHLPGKSCYLRASHSGAIACTGRC